MSSPEDRLSVGERLLLRCWSGAHLAPDSLLVGQQLLRPPPAARSAQLGCDTAGVAARWLTAGPLWDALQPDWGSTECRLCPPQEPLAVRGVRRIDTMDDSRVVMIELSGHCGWMTEQEDISPPAAPQLLSGPTASAGFVALHWTRTSECGHESPLAALPSGAVRQLMWQHCQVLYPDGSEITRDGPAVNVKRPGATDGGTDFVPCLYVPQWPFKEFISRHRQTDFPPSAVRRAICQAGVHLVPAGRPGSATESSEWQVSFHRAEEEVFRCLSHLQLATADATQSLLSNFNGSDAAPVLKPLHVRTATFWVVQSMPENRWTDIMNGVEMILGWLERRLTDGSLPCFFSKDIDLVAGFSTAELESLARTIGLLREQASRLLMAWCDERFGLHTVLGTTSYRLTHYELQHRLARLLVRLAVAEGIRYRPAAPCWRHWKEQYAPGRQRPSAQPQLEQYLHSLTGERRRQCLLLQALYVAPADVVSKMRLISFEGEMPFWTVGPLLQTLTDTDMRRLIGDTMAVPKWCRHEICQPIGKRPVGLTGSLDKPGGRAVVLLQPELFLQALDGAAPKQAQLWRQLDQETAQRWQHIHRATPSYRECRQELEALSNSDLQARLRSRLPELDGPAVAAVSELWQRRLQRLLSADSLQEKYSTITTVPADRWKPQWDDPLHSPTAGSQQLYGPDAAGDEQWRSAQQESEHEQEERERDQAYIEELEKLDRQQAQESEKLYQLHEKERKNLLEKQRQEKLETYWRHGREWVEMKRRVFSSCSN